MKVASTRGATRGFAGGRKVANVSNGTKVVMRAGNWFPGSDAPAHLPDSIPGGWAQGQVSSREAHAYSTERGAGPLSEQAGREKALVSDKAQRE